MPSGTGMKIVIIVFCAYLALLGLDLLVRPDLAFSELENRYLEERPVFSWPALLSGDYGRKLESWMADQIAGRDNWVGAKTELLRLIGKRENRGIYFGRDQVLLQRFTKPGGAALDETIAGIRHLQSLLPDLPVSLLLAPTSAAVYPDKLPALAVSDDQAAFIRQVEQLLAGQVQLVDVLDDLAEKADEPIYFCTDHHWTMRGAYYAWDSWLRQTGRPAADPDAYTRQIVSKNFYGTSWARAGLYRLPPDAIEAIWPVTPVPVRVHDVAAGETRSSLYHPEYLEKRDQYGYFLGGNQPLLVIENEKTDPGGPARSLLVVKNSFANSLIPFLLRDFDAIHVVDLRFFQDNLAAYARDAAIDEILFIYDVIGFGNDRQLRLLSRSELRSSP
ncbi:MAG: hypothetical protein GX112_11295 [Clostridiaceae bacterium]|jgi:hypothetical protein|nr:hypothetical protein [Clostridiaceae bacterium]